MNYKGRARTTIKISGFEESVPAAASIKHLTEQVALATAADGMQFENGIYQVTAGKTFHIIGVMVHVNSTGGGNVLLSSGDTENAETASIITLPLPSGRAGVTEFQVTKTLAASKFLTIKPSAAVVDYIEIIGYEL